MSFVKFISQVGFLPLTALAILLSQSVTPVVQTGAASNGTDTASVGTISLNVGLPPATAAFAVSKPSIDPSIRAKFNDIYNREWVQNNRSNSYYWNGDPASDLVKEWLSFCNTPHYRLGEKQGGKLGSQIRWLLLEKYAQHIKPELAKRLAKQTTSSAIRSKYLEIAEMATHLSGIIPQLVDGNSLSRSSQERADLQALKTKEITLQKAALELSVMLYEQHLEIYKQQGNENGLNQVYYAIESLQRDLASKGERTLLPTQNIGGGGEFLLPSSEFLSSNARYYFPYSTQDEVKAVVNKYRYRTVLPKLIDKATATILYMEQVRGLSRGESFNYLMAELGLDLWLGVTDVPINNVKKALSTIPETELRSAVRRTSNPTKAAELVDDIKRGSGTSKKTGSGSIADDVDNVRNRNNGGSNPCIASVPGSSGFIAVASDVPMPIMEFSSGKEVLVAALPVDAVARNYDCLNPRFNDSDFGSNGYGRGYKSADDFYNKLLESGETSALEFIRKNWDKGTFPSALKSVEYHLYKHGKGLTLRQYTAQANYNYKKYWNLREEVNIKQQPKVAGGGFADFGWKIDSPYGRGIYTKAGKILTFTKY